MLKWLKWWIIWLLAGQAVALFASKPALRKKFTTAQGSDKLKLVFDELVTLNKGLIESIDLTKLKGDLAFRIEHLQEDINQLTTQWSTLSKEKIQQWIAYLKTNTDQLKTDVWNYVQDLDEKHQLTEKLTTLKNHITELQTKIAE